jgi:CubicO group peptidase (beta-lactamase class C family)
VRLLTIAVGLRLLALVPIAVPLPLVAQSAVEAPAPVDTRVIDSMVAADMTERTLAGVSLAVMRDGEIVFAKGYGRADVAKGTPVDTATRFAIGSVTKQFTVALILQLDAEGRLSVRDKVAKWYPGLTRAADITLLDLMHHTSGYRDYYPLDFTDRRMSRPTTNEAIIEHWGRMPLDFEPGTRWSYSNTGYTILGRVAERVTGKPFGALLQERFFGPLDMPNTTYDPVPGGPRYATGHARFALGPLTEAEPEGRGWADAAGAIWSTAPDLLRWSRALMQGRVVQGEHLRLMTTARLLADGSSTGYGGGLSIAMMGGDTVWSHGGGVAGFISNSLMLPRTTSGMVVLSNAEGSIRGMLVLRKFITPLPPPPHDSTAPAPPRRAERTPPVVAGLPAAEAAVGMLKQLQAGDVDRKRLGADYAWFLTRERLETARRHLGPLGAPTGVKVLGLSERGGMEVANVEFTFATRTARGLMYRTPDGLIQEFLVSD